MSIPFSNTHYRIPRGFANLLEGLTREVLREQPKDIPNFAARYFSELLKKREESGFDPAEWGAALEDRYYNNHSFQHLEEKTFKARTEDVSSAGDVHVSQDRTSSIREDHGHKRDDERDHLLRDQSATIIQAAYRGHQVRDEVRKLKEESGKNDGISEKDTETPQVDPTAPQDGNVETRSLADDGASKKDLYGGGTIQDEEEARARHTQEKVEEKEDDPENLLQDEQQIQEEKDNLASTEDVKDQDHREEVDEYNTDTIEDMEGEGHREEDKEDNMATKEDMEDQDHREEAKEDNMATTEDMEGQDHRDEAKENNLATQVVMEGEELRVEAKEDNLDVTEDMEGEDHREEAKEGSLATTEDMEGQDHREEAKDDNLDITEVVGDGEEKIIESRGLDAAEGPSPERPDSSMTQDEHSDQAKMTEEHRDSSDNQDNETKQQPEAKEGEPADITTTQEQHEGWEDPREENDALRKQAEEALDIALDDPDANAAAAKIQAGFRGHMTRKKMKSGDKDVKHKEGKEGTSAQGEHEGD
ncbi:uncharacterized protein [Dendrobates tinctorius]|uniref:uncharacterized protein n=1 Tax=Dendrobates tinctorius TaxID=92724 RepID=UPI003CC9700F